MLQGRGGEPIREASIRSVFGPSRKCRLVLSPSYRDVAISMSTDDRHDQEVTSFMAEFFISKNSISKRAIMEDVRSRCASFISWTKLTSPGRRFGRSSKSRNSHVAGDEVKASPHREEGDMRYARLRQGSGKSRST
jgi:hypothetical protein